MIRDANSADSEDVAVIYNHFVVHTVVSFEGDAVSSQQMAERIREKLEAGFPWLVFEEDDSLVGFAYAGPWNSRNAYRRSAETSIYLAPDSVGRGVGSQLYRELIQRLRDLDFHTLIGGVALPNPASVGLHEKFGFEKAAHYKEVGFKFNRWIDVGYWQLIL